MVTDEVTFRQRATHHNGYEWRRHDVVGPDLRRCDPAGGRERQHDGGQRERRACSEPEPKDALSSAPKPYAGLHHRIGGPHRFVPIKNVEQQSVLSLHRVRQSFVKARIHHRQFSGYDLLSEVGVVTTCPSFTGSFGPGLKDVRTTPSLPS